MKTPDIPCLLFCARYGIGDLIMELPLIQALRRQYPAAHITALAAHPAIEVLRHHPALDQIVSLNDWGIDDRQDAGTPDTRRRVEHWFASHPFDRVYNALHTVPFVREIIFRHHAQTCELDQSAQRRVLREGGSGMEALRAGARNGWQIDIAEDAEPSLDLSNDERLAGAQYLFKRGVTQRPRVAVSPVASSDVKRWPLERFAAVGDDLLQRFGGKLPVIVGPQAEVGRKMLAEMRRSRDALTIEALHLRETAAILAHCDLLICNDTGLMQLAAAAGTRVVAIFGPTSPQIYLPAGGISVSGDSTACPRRLKDRFGPGPCIAEGECRRPAATCMACIPLAATLSAIHPLLKMSIPSYA